MFSIFVKYFKGIILGIPRMHNNRYITFYCCFNMSFKTSYLFFLIAVIVIIIQTCFSNSNNFWVLFKTFNYFIFSNCISITFKNSIDLQETFRSLPIDKVLIETDSPYLAPVPNRGKKNEPSFIDFTANKLSEIKNISKLELINKTTENFNRLFFQ